MQEDALTKNRRKTMYALLYYCGTLYFTSKDYVACVGFYNAALEYAEPDAKATVARQLVLAHKALQDLDRCGPACKRDG